MTTPPPDPELQRHRRRRLDRLGAIGVPLLALLAGGCALGAGGQRYEPAMYSVTDTSQYENTLTEGTLGVLAWNGEPVDSIDLAFGFHRVGPRQVVFLPVRSEPSEDIPPVSTDITEHVVFDGARRVVLNGILPDFNDYFSSPSVVDGMFYYWGLDRTGEGEYRVSAHRYDFGKRRLATEFLFRDQIATDFRFHLPPPFCTEGRVAFVGGGNAYLFDQHFRKIEVLPDTAELPAEQMGTAAGEPCF